MFETYCFRCGAFRRFCRCFRVEALGILAHNLAVAGALCRAFELGHPDIFTVTKRGETYTDWRMRWRPNVDGKPAP